jgi:hypothetical protein
MILSVACVGSLHIYLRNAGGPEMLFVDGNNDAFITV